MATWKEVKGTVEEKVEAIFASSAFIVHWGFRPPVQHSVVATAGVIKYTETDEGEVLTLTKEELTQNLIKIGNPPVEVSCDYGR